MLIENDLINVLKTALETSVYLDSIPETASLPSAQLTSLGESPLNTRNFSGKIRNGTEHRIGLVAESMSELKELETKLLLLDNESNELFQMFYIDFSSRDPRTEGVNVYRAFYNLTAIK